MMDSKHGQYMMKLKTPVKMAIPAILFLLVSVGLTVGLRSDGLSGSDDGSQAGLILHTFIEPPEPAAGRDEESASPRIPSPGPEAAGPGKGEPVYGHGVKRDSVEPDTHTDHHTDGVYHAVFNPTVAPLKRVNAVDRVGEDFVISVGDEHLREVGLTSPSVVSGRDFFWGSFVVQHGRSRPAPVPSVSPCMLVHEVRTIPDGVEVDFFKDGADNFFVSTNDPRAGRGGRRSRGGNVRIQVLVSGSRSYFGGALADEMRLKDLRGERPLLPGNVVGAARLVLNQIGVGHSDSLSVQLRSLVSYFRGFEEGAIPGGASNTGIPYLDLAFSRKGVCRHRAYAFVITAQALGIPARYVANEVHAFVEVIIPRMGWRRIDLGGAVPQMEILRGGDVPPHKPLRDPFPQPPGSAVTDGTGIEADSGDPGSISNPVDPARKGLKPGLWVDASKLGLEEESVDGVGEEEQDQGLPDEGLKEMASAPPGHGMDPSSFPPAVNGFLKTVEFAPVSVKTTGFRGSVFRASGRVSSSGEPLSGHRVVVLFHPPGRGAAVFVGETSTDKHGRYRLKTSIPRDIPPGSYKVHVHAPVQGEYEKATSR